MLRDEADCSKIRFEKMATNLKEAQNCGATAKEANEALESERKSFKEKLDKAESDHKRAIEELNAGAVSSDKQLNTVVDAMELAFKVRYVSHNAEMG